MTNLLPSGSDIYTLSQQIKAALLRRDAATLSRLTSAYTAMYARLKGSIEALTLTIGDQAMTKGQITRLSQYADLMTAIRREVGNYGGYLSTEVSATAQANIRQATQDIRRLMSTIVAGDRVIMGRFQYLNPAVIETLLGFLAPGGKLYQRIDQLSGYTAEKISQTIIENVGLGKNPRVIASLIRDDLGGSLTDALRTARTVQIRSYNEASRANYAANPDVVTGWIWVSALDDRTCEACISMHGTIHSLDDTLDGHYQCRCSMIPITPFDSDKVQTGEAWFNEQTEDRQREILGPGKYEAYTSGQIAFSQLATQEPNEIYGSMRSATPLKDLVGD